MKSHKCGQSQNLFILQFIIINTIIYIIIYSIISYNIIIFVITFHFISVIKSFLSWPTSFNSDSPPHCTGVEGGEN